MGQFYFTKNKETQTITIFQKISGEPDKSIVVLEYGNDIQKMREKDADSLIKEMMEALTES